VERDDQPKQILNDQRKEFEPIAIKFRQRSRVFIAFLLTGVALLIIASFSGFSKSGWFIGFYMLCILSGMITVFFLFQNCAVLNVLRMPRLGLIFIVLNVAALTCRKIISFLAENAVIVGSRLETARVEVM